MEEEFYLEFGGVNYYVDFEALDNLLAIDKKNTKKMVIETETITSYDNENNVIGKTVTKRENERNKEIDLASYETLRLLMEVVFSYQNDDMDDTLGAQRALDSSTLPFKLSFNTLIKYGIIKEC
jgi:hypothetical protein